MLRDGFFAATMASALSSLTGVSFRSLMTPGSSSSSRDSGQFFSLWKDPRLSGFCRELTGITQENVDRSHVP
jgi:hypothetical protein